MKTHTHRPLMLMMMMMMMMMMMTTTMMMMMMMMMMIIIIIIITGRVDPRVGSGRGQIQGKFGGSGRVEIS